VADCCGGAGVWLVVRTFASKAARIKGQEYARQVMNVDYLFFSLAKECQQLMPGAIKVDDGISVSVTTVRNTTLILKPKANREAAE
jgi:hypothetical protein